MRIKKIFLFALILFGTFFLFSTLFVWGLQAIFEAKPVVKDNSVLEITLRGSVTEWFSRDAFSREFERASIQLHDIRKSLAMAKIDKRIKGVYLKIANPQLGWAKAEAIRRILVDFKDAGKFVTAYLDYCDEKAYYIALAADEIYLPPHAFTGLNGFAIEVPFIKRTFNKLGMKPQVENIGKYKSAGDVLKRESMSPAHREATAAVLKNVYEHFVSSVCQSRDIARSGLEALLAKGVFNSNELADTGLIDGLKYDHQVLEAMKEKSGIGNSGQDLRSVSIHNYARLSPDELGGEKLALVYAVGTILPGHSGHDPLNGRTLGATSILEMLRRARTNKEIKAVVLRVDSPGGSAQASDQIWAEIERVRETKPVIVSMSDVAASGGYWISMDSDAIVAEPLTITGSIGVVSTVFDLSETYDKLGIDWETVKMGRFADMPTDKRALTLEERQRFKQMNRDFYDLFVQKVADGREMSWSDVDRIAQGRVWTGNEALKLGLIDTLGGLETAVSLAKEKAGIDPDALIQMEVYPQPRGLLESFMDKLSVTVMKNWFNGNDALSMLHYLPPETMSILRQLSYVGFMRTGGILALEPYVPVVE